MTSDRRVLVVDRTDGALAGVMEELDLLGFRVVWVPSPAAALAFIKTSPTLSLVIVSATAAEDGGDEFLTEVKRNRPDLRVLCGTKPNAPPSLRRGAFPDSLIPEPFRPNALRTAVSALLAEQFYPTAIATAIKSSALEVLGTLGEFRVDAGEFLVPNQTALSDLSAIIAFSGEASGHLMLSMTSEDARSLYLRFVPGARAVPVDRLEDLVGELCNRILGRLSAFFAQHAMSIQQTTPLFIRAAGSTMRYPGRHPSFGVQLTRGDARVSLEYYLADFDRSKLASGATKEVLGLGEILFF
ncbi:MAG TPA: chemotaxis protein CheX [Polyangiaceae bacterium]